MTTPVGTPLGVAASQRSDRPIPTPPVTTGLAFHLDAADASTFSYSSGTLVSQWRDKSGNGRHFSQATVAKQPSRNGTRNGWKTVVFSGGSGNNLASTVFTLPQPFTILMAVDAVARAQTGWISSQGGNFQIYADGAPPLHIYAGGDFASGVSPAGVGVHTFVVNGASSVIYRDNVSLVTGNAGTSGTTTGMYVGIERGQASLYVFQGDMFEVVVYDRVIDATERGQLQAYFVTKWGTPV